VAPLLLDMLPPELAAISTPGERAAEYLDCRHFVIGWETLDRVTECRALETSGYARSMAQGLSGMRSSFPFPLLLVFLM
jgi:nuclear pore complex protein Nup107